MSSEPQSGDEDPHVEHPEKWAEWHVMADNELSLFAGGQAWIKTNATVEVRP